MKYNDISHVKKYHDICKKKCTEYTKLLIMLSQTKGISDDQRTATQHLLQFMRYLYKYRGRLFSKEMIASIKSAVQQDESKLIPLNIGDTDFIRNHHYFFDGGTYQVLSTEPGLDILIRGTAMHYSSDLKKRMWSEHLSVMGFLLNAINSFVAGPKDLDHFIEECTKEAEREITRRHAEFLSSKRLKPAGLKKSSRKHRITHCYNCEEHLDNTIQLECNACGWIVCDCGACGCGYNQR